MLTLLTALQTQRRKWHLPADTLYLDTPTAGQHVLMYGTSLPWLQEAVDCAQECATCELGVEDHEPYNWCPAWVGSEFVPRDTRYAGIGVVRLSKLHGAIHELLAADTIKLTHKWEKPYVG